MPINTGIRLKIPVKDGTDNGYGQSDAGYTEMFQAVNEFLRIRIGIHCHIDGCACQSEADDDDDRPDDHRGATSSATPFQAPDEKRDQAVHNSRQESADHGGPGPPVAFTKIIGDIKANDEPR